MIKKKETAGITSVVLMAAVCLTLKISCFVVWQTIEYPNDLPLTLLSLAYYISLGVLCFFCGKTKISSVLAALVLSFEVLVQLIVILYNGPAAFGALYFLIATSGYALTEMIHAFENVGQTISNWYYFAAFVIVQLLFMGIILIGRKIWAKGRG